MATTVRVGRREFVRFAELHQALAEAYLVSTSKGGARCMYVLSLARYYDGERDGFVVLEKAAQGQRASGVRRARVRVMKMTLRDQAAAFVVGCAIVFLAGVVLVGMLRDAYRDKRKRRHDLDSWFGRTDE